MVKLVMMIRVKDGILFIRQWLENMEKLMDEIVAVDNGSTDGTYEILKAHPKVVELIKTEGFNEGRDKLILYELARKRKPDWCIWLDVDEIFEERVTYEKLHKLMDSKFINLWNFRRFYMHPDDRHFSSIFLQIIEQACFSRNMWREQPNAYFSGAYIHDGGIHNVKGIKSYSMLRIKHLVNAVPNYKEYRTKKYEDAIRIDPSPSNQEMYKQNLQLELMPNQPTWKWYEYSERPIWVCLQILLLNILFVAYFLFRIPRKLYMILNNGLK